MKDYGFRPMLKPYRRRRASCVETDSTTFAYQPWSYHFPDTLSGTGCHIRCSAYFRYRFPVAVRLRGRIHYQSNLSMKCVIVICTACLFVNSGMLLCQKAGDSHITFQPALNAVWVEVLVLPVPVFPAAGVGADLRLFEIKKLDSPHAHSSMGLRLWYGVGTDESILSGEKKTRVYTDIDLLATWKLPIGRYSLTFLAGYGERNTDGWDGRYSGGRLKYGIELNDLLIAHLMSVRIRVMAASFGNSFRDFELGPIAMGLAVGWFHQDD